MGLVPTPEQDAFRRSVRAFLDEKSTEREVRRVMATESGYDPAVWSRLAGQLGVTGLAIPEEYGGSGYSFEELAIALEESGRRLLCAPLLSSVVTSMALLTSGDEAAKKELLPGLASGATIGTLALTNARSEWGRQGTTVTARPSSEGWELSGRAPFVLDGHAASLVLVPARSPSGTGLFTVDGDDRTVRRTPRATLDPTRRLAQLDFDRTPARRLGTDGPADALVDQVLRVASVALANEQAGVAGAALEMAVGYAKDRVQFGRPIGSFQAIKHTCADLHVAVESARSAAYMAAAAVAAGSPDLPEIAAIAASFCSEACLRAGHDNVQIHGGIGFTWEHPAHLYYKRAKASEFLFGDVPYHRELLARAIGI